MEAKKKREAIFRNRRKGPETMSFSRRFPAEVVE